MKNAYFELMEQVCKVVDDMRGELMARKTELQDAGLWDSEELEEVYKDIEAMKYPYSDGAIKAYRAWKYGEGEKDGYLVMNDFLWDREVADFMEAVNRAGFKGIIYTNTSTAVMENIHSFVDGGWFIKGAVKYEKTENRFGEEETELVKGLMLSWEA